MASILKTLVLFFLTACAEILGCYLPYLFVRKEAPWWVLLPAALSLGAFAWLLTLHPSGAGRTYAAYGGVYAATAVFWLWAVEGQSPDACDLIGASVSIFGMGIILFGPRS